MRGESEMKYRTRPEEVNAIQHTGANFYSVYEFTNGDVKEDANDDDIYLIESDGVTVVHPSDWIVDFGVGVYGVFDNDGFENHFESV